MSASATRSILTGVSVRRVGSSCLGRLTTLAAAANRLTEGLAADRDSAGCTSRLLNSLRWAAENSNMHVPADRDVLVYAARLGAADSFTFAVVGEPAREPPANLVRTFKRAHAMAEWRRVDVWFREEDGTFALMKRFRSDSESSSALASQPHETTRGELPHPGRR